MSRRYVNHQKSEEAKDSGLCADPQGVYPPRTQASPAMGGGCRKRIFKGGSAVTKRDRRARIIPQAVTPRT